MRKPALTTLVLAFVANGCLYDFERGLTLEPGDVSGHLFKQPEGSEVDAAFARVVPEGAGRVLRASSTGDVLVRGLSAGGWMLRFDDDENGDGNPEWASQQPISLSVQHHRTGPFGDTEEKLTFFVFGEKELTGVVEVTGRVTVGESDDGAVGAKVYVIRKATVPSAVVDGDGTVRESLDILLGADAVTTTDSSGAFRFPAVAAGDFQLVAFQEREGVLYGTVPKDVSAEPGAALDVGPLTTLALQVAPATRAAQLELTPVPSSDDRVKVILMAPGEQPTTAQLSSFDNLGEREYVLAGGPSLALDVPVGMWDVWVVTESNRRATLVKQAAPIPGDPLVVWGLAHASEGDPCAGDGIRDCDADAFQQLPGFDDAEPSAADRAIWEACGAECYDAFGTAAATQSCTVDGEVYDCDDDGNGQPDMTEPAACRTLTGGGDRDGDGLCDASDPYPQCASNDPSDPACGADRDDTFTPPAVRPEYGGPPIVITDAGPSDGGADDGGDVDAGDLDAGIIDTDAGPLLDLGPVLPLYPTNGANWNQYVRNDGADRFSGNDTDCDPAAVTNPLRMREDCLHGGQMRTVVLPNIQCSPALTASDALGVFEWTCLDDGGDARFVSSDFKPGKGLTDLLDFTNALWLPNRVTVSHESDGQAAQSTVTEWWTNPISVDNGGMGTGNATAGSIYIVNVTIPGGTYTVDADEVAIVIDPAIVVERTNGNSTASYGHWDFVNADFGWFEGAMDGTTGTITLTFVEGAFGVVRNLRGYDADPAIQIFGADFTLIEGLRIHNENASFDEVEISAETTQAVGTVILDAKVYNASMYLEGERTRVLDVYFTGSQSRGLWTAGLNHVAMDVRIFNTATAEFYDNGYGGAVWSRMTLGGGGSSSDGFILRGLGNPPTHTARHMTVAATGFANNNFGGQNLRVSDVLAVQTQYGWYMRGVSDSVFEDMVSTHAHYEHAIETAGGCTNNRFTGRLKVGFGDVVGTGLECGRSSLEVNAGLIEGTCTDTGLAGSSVYTGELSDAVLSVDVDGHAIIVGEITEDDVANPIDDAGFADPAELTAVAAWSFDNELRGFNADLIMSDIAEVDPCSSSGPPWCRIYDWSLRAGEMADPNGGGAGVAGPAALGVNAVPTGDETQVHVWYTETEPVTQADCDAAAPGSSLNDQGTPAFCETAHLRDTAELMFDWDGNENGLCESGERCLFHPNIGSYQGHGELTAVTFTPGALTGVQLFRYDTNGR
jgi:hypothetical protein